MSLYLHDIPLPEAKSRFEAALRDANLWRVLGTESIPLDENALGRVLAGPVWAKISSPHYHASAMDGFAVRAEDTSGAQPTTPLQLAVIGSLSSTVNRPSSARYVDTGDPLPEWADAVIPIENVESLDADGNISSAIRAPSSIRIRAAVAPWSHVRPMGEDIVATQLVLPAGHVLRPVDLGAIAAAGHQQIGVARKPRVAILPTGSELVPIGSKLQAGDILEYNSLVLAAQIKAMGGEATRYPIVKDDFDLICQRVMEAAQDHDLILLNAGSSAGAEDFSAKVVEKLGTLLVHGVAVRPGHPVILGMVKRESGVESRESDNLELGTWNLTPIIGVPGYPVSAALTIDIFVEPILAKWLGRRPKELPVETAQLTRKINSPAGDEDYVRVVAGKVGDKLLAAPLSRGAGVITSLVQADGLVVIPPGVQGLEAGEKVNVRLYRNKAELERTIFCIGSHDLTLDLMAQFLAEHDRRLVSANVGSQGGLIALRRGEAHLAGSHLLDPVTGEYNVSYIRQYLPDVPVRVLALVKRDQGLLVRRGNPQRVKTLEDLTRPQVRFVNRQRGAGTRVLLDYHLSLKKISPDSIRGYNQEEYTHLGVAAAIASGRADCGLGVAAAAQALDLDFIPLFQERYDLVIPKEHAESNLLAPLFGLLGGRGFREAVSKLMGYDVSVMGALILEDQ
ncbi:MAG: molybdopterin biosynthesis protein [Chloroflexi bacterium]|nr:molybdopterin biosynthesis protein [Chloroflexota bacterium]MBI3339363.1 molybdopterin biosynthesis protein [Chloroflexota bacterium]